MIAIERQKKILQMLDKKGAASISYLKKTINVSDMTLWRDLEKLRKQGMIDRVYGGVIKIADITSGNELSYEKKIPEHQADKEKIARYAAKEFVEDGDVICLEGGTTVAGLVRFLNNMHPTILTNSIKVVLETGNFSGINTICSGGVFRHISGTFVGPSAQKFFEEHHFNKLFISATGLNLKAGLTDPNPLEIQVKRAMIKPDVKVIGLIDSSKFESMSAFTVAKIKELDVLVTDSHAPADVVEQIRSSGVDVRIVDAE